MAKLSSHRLIVPFGSKQVTFLWGFNGCFGSPSREATASFFYDLPSQYVAKYENVHLTMRVSLQDTKRHSSCSCYVIMVWIKVLFYLPILWSNYDSIQYNFYSFCHRVLTQVLLFGRSCCALLPPKKIMKLFSWCALWEQQLTMRDFSIEKALAIATSGVE